MNPPKNYGLILNPPEPDHWTLGSGLAAERFGADELNPSGDWTPRLPQDEEQRKYGLETSACVPFATLKAWIMLAILYGFDDFPKDCSERYSGVHCGVTRNGSNPHTVAEITRKSAGAVPNEVMSWNEDCETWEEFYDRRMAESLLPLGRKLLDRFELGHEWVFPFGSNLTLKEKRERLKEALKRGPVCVSVYAWTKKGKYYINPLKRHNHWVLAVRFDGNRLVIHDQYSPFLKTLDTSHEVSAAKVYFLKRREDTDPGFWGLIWTNFKNLWSRSV